jgi:DNA-binding LacI/PurR family transcriptional regulator
MARKPPTMRDVALRAGVSPATVSNVLGDRKPVDPALAERVRAAAADLDYRIDRAASLLRSGKTQVICALVPSLENPFFTSLIAAIERRLRADGYDIIIASGNDEGDERARMAALLSWRPAGVVVVPSSDAFASRALLEDGRIPYVTVDRVTDEQDGDAVTVDNAAASGLAARHLLELGHRRVLVVASSLRYANIRERCVGIGEVYRAAGLDAPKVLEVGLSFEEIDERLERALAADPRPTGVIALTNFATMGVIASLKRLGVVAPDDISLIGFDDYTWMQVASPSITAVAQPIERMADAAWQQLRARIAGDDHTATRLKLGCRLEVRQSTRAVGPPLLSEIRPVRRTVSKVKTIDHTEE